MPKITPIKIYRSSIPGNVPTIGQLDYGELGLNYADRALFFKDSNNVIQNLAAPKSVWARTFAFMGS